MVAEIGLGDLWSWYSQLKLVVNSKMAKNSREKHLRSNVTPLFKYCYLVVKIYD